MMAKAWKDVIASPQYQQLPPEQQSAAQDQYFNEVVAPQAGEQAEAARQQFFTAYPPAVAAQAPQEQTQAQKIGTGFAETGKALLQAGVNVANIPAEIADAFTSAGSWAANQIGIGDGTYSPSPRLTTQGIASGIGLQQDALTPQSTEGKIFAEALPYLTPVSASRFGAAAPTLAGRVTQGASRLLAENATGALAANSGEDGSIGGVAQDLGIGVLAGGGVNLAAKGIGAAAKAIGNRGVEAAGKNLRNVVTRGAQPSELGATARTIAESPDSSLLSRNVNVQGAGGQSASVTPQIYRAVEEVRPNQSTIDAAQRLGMEDQLLPSHFSKNPTYRAIEQGLKSVPASQLAAQEHVAINTLAQKADDLIELAGGTSNKVGLSDKFKTESVKAIDDLTKKSDAIYGEISSKIPARAPSVATNTISMLRSKAKDLGGVENLSPAEKMIFTKLGKKGSTPTYALLDNTRKQIGAAISKNEGPFKDQTSSELKRLYGAITDDQKVVAAAHGMGDKWDVAKGLVSQRKQLEDHMVTALGKDLGGTFTSRFSPAVQGLRKGNAQQFNTLIAATPPHMRQEVVASALNDAFTLGSRKEQQLNIPGFVDWYSGAKRSGSLPAVKKHLPADAAKRLDDIYAVANGIRVAKSSEISTGRIQSLLDQFDKDGGMISKVYNVGKKVAAAEGVSSSVGLPGAGTASVIASTLAGKKTARTVAADQLLASSKFRNAAKLMASADSVRLASAREGVEKALTRSREYQRWAATLDDPTRQAIAKVGLLNWFGGTSKEK